MAQDGEIGVEEAIEAILETTFFGLVEFARRHSGRDAFVETFIREIMDRYLFYPPTFVYSFS